jgi:hypothetical protein
MAAIASDCGSHFNDCVAVALEMWLKLVAVAAELGRAVEDVCSVGDELCFFIFC